MTMTSGLQQKSSGRVGVGRPRGFNREEALTRAMRLFWKQGYETTSMADLRAELKLTQASIYAAFGSKAQLFREAVALYRATAGSSTARALREAPTARAAVESMLYAALRTFQAPGAPGGCMVVLSALNCSEGGRAVSDQLAQFRRETETQLLERLRRGQAEGDVPEGAPLKETAGFYTTVLHGLSIQSRDGASPASLKGAAAGAMAAWDVLVCAACKKEGTDEA